jgi:prevent-host-death family protein
MKAGSAVATRIRIKDLEPITATRAKVIFGDVLHQTSVNGKRFVVNRQGRPVSVILSYNEYCELIEQAKGLKEKGKP